MAINPSKLKPAELVKLVNSTDFGTVVTSVIRRQENLWLARLAIPFERIGLSDELLHGSRFVFAHYSYTTGHDEPEITSTAAT